MDGVDADDLAAVTALSQQLRARVESTPLPPELAQAIERAYRRLNADHQAAVAVRSSATTEDAVDASFAGLQDTYLWVQSLEQTLDKVRSCWGSLYSVESITYRRRHGFPEREVAMAVVVQTMVDARTAGVMFTRSPLTGDRSVMAIEGSWGLGSAVVGGEVTPDRWVVGKITGEISVREISDKQIRHAPLTEGGIHDVAVEESQRRIACMSDAELEALRLIGRKVERHYGRPQDIEWAVDRHSAQILLLQSRPETVWSSREAAPVGRPAEGSVLACAENLRRRESMSLTAADVAEIMRLVEESGFDELTLEMEGTKISLRRGAPAGSTGCAARRRDRNGCCAIGGAGCTGEVGGVAADPGLKDLPSPLLGTFYRAPKPGAPPFVEVGSQVEADSIVGIIEVMKLMNTVRAGCAARWSRFWLRTGRWLSTAKFFCAFAGLIAFRPAHPDRESR